MVKGQPMAAYQRERRALKREQGVCLWCSRPREDGRVLCGEHREVNRRRAWERYSRGKCLG